MSEITAQPLLDTDTVEIRDMHCQGRHAHPSDEECTSATYLVFPYRGAFVRHVGRDQAVADANQVLFFNAGEEYRISHPVAGGDATLSVLIADPLLRELSPPALLRTGTAAAFHQRRVRIDARAQTLVALLRHNLRRGMAEPLEAETLALTLARHALGHRATSAAATTAGRQRLADRIKLLLTSDPARRWTLAEIATDVRHSPVYLTQVFQQVEGLPLYRYQLRLRLARALELLPRSDDLTALSLDLGFSSHSHFSTAFAKVYGYSPSRFRHAASRR